MTDRIRPRRRRDARPARLSRLRADPPGTVLRGTTSMTINGWIQIALFCAIVIAAREAARRLHDARLRRRAHLPVARAAARSSAASIALCGVDETQRAALGRPMRSPCCCSASPASSSLYALQRLQAVLPFNPAGQSRGRAGPRLQHRDQLRHQHQLAVLRAGNDDELLVADGRADGAQLRLGRDRHRAGGRADPRLRAALGAGHRQFLGRSDPLHALRPAADLDRRRRCSSSGRACRRTSAPIPRRRRWKAPSRSSRRGRWPRRKSSRCWAPMAAASSTPTRRIRSRTRTRSPTWSRWC